MTYSHGCVIGFRETEFLSSRLPVLGAGSTIACEPGTKATGASLGSGLSPSVAFFGERAVPRMPNQPPSDRLKTEMPQIPGVSTSAPQEQLGFRPLRLAGFLAALLICLLTVRWLLRPKTADLPVAAPAAQIEEPAPAANPSAATPNSQAMQPCIASLRAKAQ